MSTFTDLKQELKNKERSINDLIRFIDTKTDNNPNYSLLLGAGCSITSGINSANQLIDKWKKEIFLQENELSETDYDEKKADDFFSKEMWFDSRNPYSALFEKKYDLPRQRRMFIEKEVRDKSPSIGYAYLINLVQNNYFKTIFTTNFDDLLNEAFYQYSHERPLICAHDSAISSITVTSKRPKIIKLHGDYLFDDIKSTLRETESLEENIKNKFIEFSKDYGLIILGYGGNDRSIVDVLTYLLKNEDYFKNGIYWCLRGDSEINEDLRKLLWKDRVFYVKIDGFDELMAEINAKLNDSKLPIDSSYLNEKRNELITNLISNPYLKGTSCSYILNDFEKLKNTKDRDVISNFFNFLETKNDDENEVVSEFKKKNDKKKYLDDEEKVFLSNLNEELFTSNFKYIITLIDEKIKNVDKSSEFYLKLLDTKAKSSRSLNKINDAIDCYKELVELDKKNLKDYIHLSDLLEDYKEKILYLDKAIQVDPFYGKLYFKKAEILIDKYNSIINKESLEYSVTEINEILEKSLEVSPGIQNSAWYLKAKWIRINENNTESIIEKFQNIINLLEKQDSCYPNYVALKVELMGLQKQSSQSVYDYIKKVISDSPIDDYLKKLEFLLLNAYAENNDIDELRKRLLYIENLYEVDNDYWQFKAQIQLEKFDDLDSAIQTLKSIKVKSESDYDLLFTYLVFKKEFKEAKDINEKFLNNDKSNLSTLYEEEKRYEDALIICRELRQKDDLNLNLHIREAHLLLKLKKYQEAYNFLNSCLKHSNFTEPYLLINYFIASKNHRTLKSEKVKEKLLNGHNHKDIIQAGAYSLMKDEKNAYSKLSSLIKSDFSYKYLIRDFAVFEDLFKKDQFKSLLEN